MTKLPYPSILLLAGLFLLAGCQRQNLKPNLQTADMAREKAARRHEVLGDRYHEQQRDAEAKQEWTLALQLQPSNEALKQKMAMITTGGKRPYRIKAGAVKATGSAPLDKLLLQAEQF